MENAESFVSINIFGEIKPRPFGRSLLTTGLEHNILVLLYPNSLQQCMFHYHPRAT